MILIQIWRNESGRHYTSYRMREKFSQTVARIITLGFWRIGISIEIGASTPTFDQCARDWRVIK